LAARFPSLCSMEHGELTICRRVQGTLPFWLTCDRLCEAIQMSYGRYIKARERPMSRNSVSGTGQISSCWNKRLKKWRRVVMASRSLSMPSKRACVRMTAERFIHRKFRFRRADGEILVGRPRLAVPLRDSSR
jgi:hypothetical protein